ncbi:MAG: hypothetical protein ACTSQ7_16020 [Alphaproteobacteria bacterium]
MPDGVSDRQRLRAEQVFFDEVELGVRVANREMIRARIPELDRDKIHALAVMVGRLRASYLELAFQMCAAGDGAAPETAIVENLRERRLMFEEARDAYEALRRAVERGYIDIPEFTG